MASEECGSGTEQTVYLVELGCNHCEETTTFATKGPAVGVDRDAPWPAVDHCPLCAASYPDDLGWVIQSVHEAKTADPDDGLRADGSGEPGTEHELCSTGGCDEPRKPCYTLCEGHLERGGEIAALVGIMALVLVALLGFAAGGGL